MSGLKNVFKNAKYEKDIQDWRTNHGGSEGGAFVPGVRLIRPLDAYGKTLPSGSDYVLPEGKVTIYDGNVRYIDEEVFDHDVEQFARRQKHVDKLVKAFLMSGDAVCIKYIGYHYNWLKANAPAEDSDQYNALVSYMVYDGMTTEAAKSRVDNIIPWDGTPDHINSYTNPSSDYTNCLNKLMTILKYTCVIFMGKEGAAAPDIGAAAETTWSDPNTESSERSKAEVNKKRFGKIQNGAGTGIVPDKGKGTQQGSSGNP